LSSKRFLDIAAILGRETTVVTDNDGHPEKITDKYKDYEKYANIKICSSDDESLPSLEPQIVDCNERADLNAILGTSFDTKDELKAYMRSAKTDCALAIFDSSSKIEMPQYISEAING
jgi:putative ATP-dependent endonuclease of OLD family